MNITSATPPSRQFVFLSLITAILAVTMFPAWPALPLKAIRKLQENSPEALVIEIVEVKRNELTSASTSPRLKVSHSIQYSVKAKVVSVDRSATKLKAGSVITINYNVPDMKKSPEPGDYPGGVEKGKTYRAFLEKAPGEGKKGKEKEKDYRPGAASGSFEEAKK